jgi:NAD(P)H-hydrate epimerase
MSLPLPETPGGRIAWAAKDRLAKVLSQFSSVAVGPGLGQSVGLVALVAWLYRECPCPMVLDADALNAMSAALSQGRLERAGVDRPARLLTPHPGEFARLWQAYRSRVARAAGRWPTTEPVVRGAQQVGPLSLTEEQAIRFAADLDVHVVLKGAGTLITDGRRVARNLTGNPGMATGGSGDGLTGILAADLAQGSDAFTAARRGCFVHGRAGDLAAQAKGEHAMNASDLLDHLSEAWKTLEKCREHME